MEDAVQSRAAVSLVMALDGAATVAAPCDLGLCPPTANQDARRRSVGELVPGQHRCPDLHRHPCGLFARLPVRP